MTLVLLKSNGKMLSQSSSGDVVYVFMSSLRQQMMKSDVCNVSEQNRVSLPFIHSFTQRLAEHAIHI